MAEEASSAMIAIRVSSYGFFWSVAHFPDRSHRNLSIVAIASNGNPLFSSCRSSSWIRYRIYWALGVSSITHSWLNGHLNAVMQCATIVSLPCRPLGVRQSTLYNHCNCALTNHCPWVLYMRLLCIQLVTTPCRSLTTLLGFLSATTPRSSIHPLEISRIKWAKIGHNKIAGNPRFGLYHTEMGAWGT